LWLTTGHSKKIKHFFCITACYIVVRMARGLQTCVCLALVYVKLYDVTTAAVTLMIMM